MPKITPTEEWQKAVRDHIDKLDDDEKYNFAHSIIFDTALWCGYNLYETIGIIEIVKAELIEAAKSAIDLDDEENEKPT